MHKYCTSISIAGLLSIMLQLQRICMLVTGTSFFAADGHNATEKETKTATKFTQVLNTSDTQQGCRYQQQFNAIVADGGQLEQTDNEYDI